MWRCAIEPARLATAIALTIATGASAQSGLQDKLRGLYFKRLNEWVATADVTKIQSEVVQNCGKLMYLRDPTFGVATPKAVKDDLDVRIDICAQMTIHRAIPQPIFSKPDTIKFVCVEMANDEPAFAHLCEVARLKP